jgi:hypothetical protein
MLQAIGGYMIDDQNPVDDIKPEQISGRSIFIVETTAGGIQVQTGFLAEDGRVLQLPAIFPTQEYALTQIDELRNVVIQHFAQAAQVGSQVIAQAKKVASSTSASDLEGPSPEDTIQ